MTAPVTAPPSPKQTDEADPVAGPLAPADTPIAAAPPAAFVDPRDKFFAVDHLMDDLKGRSVRGGAVTLGTQAIKFVLQLGSTAVLARLLTPADFGLIAMVAVFTGFVGLFKDLGLSMATVQREHITHAQVSTLFWINVALSILLAGIGCALAPVVAWFYGEPRLLWVTVAISCTFIFGGLAAQHTALLRRQMRFGGLAVRDITSQAVGLTVAVSLALDGWTYWALVAQVGATGMVGTLSVWTASGWRPGAVARDAELGRMLRFGGHLTGFTILNYGVNNLDYLLLGRVWGPNALGIYNKAFQLMSIPSRQLAAPVRAVAMPGLSRLANDPSKLCRSYETLVGRLAILLCPIIAFVVAVPELTVDILLGSQWVDASPILFWLALGSLRAPLSNTAGTLLTSLGMTRELFRWGFIGGAVMMTGIVVGLPYGARGVAVAYTVATLAVGTPLLLIYLSRVTEISVRSLGKAMVPSGLLTSAVLVAVEATDVVVSKSGLGTSFEFAACSFVAIATFLAGCIGTRSIRVDIASLYRSAVGR